MKIETWVSASGYIEQVLEGSERSRISHESTNMRTNHGFEGIKLIRVEEVKPPEPATPPRHRFGVFEDSEGNIVIPTQLIGGLNALKFRGSPPKYKFEASEIRKGDYIITKGTLEKAWDDCEKDSRGLTNPHYRNLTFQNFLKELRIL